AARPPHPNFWVAQPFSIPANAGENRTHWDLRYDDPTALTHSYEINANPGLTPASPEGPVAPPGTYTVKITVDGKNYTQTVVVKPDPRAPASVAAIRAQHALQMRIVQGLEASYKAHEAVSALAAAVRAAAPSSAASELGDAAAKATSFAAHLDSIAGPEGGRGGGFGGFGRAQSPTFRGLNATFGSQLVAQDLGDLAPTSSTLAGF